MFCKYDVVSMTRCFMHWCILRADGDIDMCAPSVHFMARLTFGVLRGCFS